MQKIAPRWEAVFIEDIQTRDRMTATATTKEEKTARDAAKRATSRGRKPRSHTSASSEVDAERENTDCNHGACS